MAWISEVERERFRCRFSAGTQVRHCGATSRRWISGNQSGAFGQNELIKGKTQVRGKLHLKSLALL